MTPKLGGDPWGFSGDPWESRLDPWSGRCGPMGWAVGKPAHYLQVLDLYVKNVDRPLKVLRRAS